MAGLTDAGHAQYDPSTPLPLLVIVSRPVENRPEGAPRLWGKLRLTVSPDSLAYRAYGRTDIEESFACNYELNPVYRGRLEESGLKVSGATADGGARIVELPGHRFYLATGFLPQYSSEVGKPHPLIVAFLKNVLKG